MTQLAATLATAPSPPSLGGALAGALTCLVFVAVVCWAVNEQRRRRIEELEQRGPAAPGQPPTGEDRTPNPPTGRNPS